MRLIEASEILSGPRWLRAAVLTGIAFCAVLPLVATALYSLATVWRRKPLPDDFTPPRAVTAAPWWRRVPGASWLRPEARTSHVDGRGERMAADVDDNAG